ncbi:MAG: sigma-E processing peptidase SpoIIGA [Oscillospiraceae bacterium]|nr:sigma-E processing peptidase SpoIIGA [Oscillospiraceae bacterium]
MFEFAADYTMLWASGKLCGKRRKTLKLAAAALIGAAYSVAAVFSAFATALPIKLCISALMLVTAYGGERGLARLSGVFFIMNAVFAGLTMALNIHTVRALLLSLAISAGICAIPFRFAGRKERAELIMRSEYGEVKLTAFIDSGNKLREPISGGHVIVSGEKRLEPLLSPRARSVLRSPGDAGAADRLLKLGAGYRLIPYRTVGSESGLLLAFKPDEVIINGKKKEGIWAAMSPAEINMCGCDALIGEE